jgi:hypothetical protein
MQLRVQYMYNYMMPLLVGETSTEFASPAQSSVSGKDIPRPSRGGLTRVRYSRLATGDEVWRDEEFRSDTAPRGRFEKRAKIERGDGSGGEGLL